MQALSLLQKHLIQSCDTHLTRINSLVAGVHALMKGQNLSVTGLGRSLRQASAPKYDIARMDYLVGNKHLFAERAQYYRSAAALLIKGKARPIIAVDWSSATVVERFLVLRAGLIANGRAFPIYEELYPLNKYNNRTVHNEFLLTLKTILPADSCPVIVTDAGFFGPWFAAVVANGWDYVSRASTHTGYSYDGETWNDILNLRKIATARAKSLGKILLAKRNKLSCHLYIVKKKPKGRLQKNCYGDKSYRSTSLKCSKSNKEPWIIVSSLQSAAHEIMKIYAFRMQIEESFRDIKSPQFGFGLRNSRSQSIMRFSNLFLIAMLATILLWLMGLSLRLNNEAIKFQANTIRKKNVLSIFFLGCQVVNDERYHFKGSALRNALVFLKGSIQYVL